MKKIKTPLILEGLAILFAWIGGLMIDETIQKSILQYPDSWKLYQLILSLSPTDKIITTVLIFLWIFGSLIYIFHKIKD